MVDFPYPVGRDTNVSFPLGIESIALWLEMVNSALSTTASLLRSAFLATTIKNRPKWLLSNCGCYPLAVLYVVRKVFTNYCKYTYKCAIKLLQVQYKVVTYHQPSQSFHYMNRKYIGHARFYLQRKWNFLLEQQTSCFAYHIFSPS